MARELSEATLKSYASSIKRLESLTDADFNNFPVITSAIEASKYADSSKNMIYCALLRQSINAEAKKSYEVSIKKYQTKRATVADNQTPTEAQKAKFVKWEDLEKVRDKAEEDVKDAQSYMNYLIVCLYTMTEPARLDYGDMKIVFTDRLFPKGGNLCVLKKTKPYFLFREFKTSKAEMFKGKPNRVDIPAPLADVIRKWVELYNPPYLLMTEGGQPMSDANLSLRITSVFKKYTGKAVGATMIRHAYSTFHHKDTKTLKVQKLVAKNMGHSVVQNHQYRFIDEE